MADNVISSFFVALGFDVNKTSLDTAKKSVADYEKAVRDADARVLKAKTENAKAEVQINAQRDAARAKEALAAAQAAQKIEKAEGEQARRRIERSREFGLAMSRMATAATAAATAIAYAVAKVAGSFDNLYFQAQRSGTSVGSLKALGYAFQQTGGTAQQAGAAVDSFTTALRNNPGLRQFVKDLGVNESLQGVDKLLATVDALKKEPYEVGVQHASMLGISEQDFNLFSRQGEALKRYRAEYEATAKSFGMNSDQAAATATAFQRSLTRLQASVEILGQKLLIQLAPALERIIKGISEWLDRNPDTIEKFFSLWEGFAGRVSAVASAFETIWNVLKKIDEWLHVSAIYKFIDKLGSAIISGRINPGSILLNQFGGGGIPGVGAVGGFNPTEGGGGGGGGGDDRNLWQRHAPKWLGGKDAPGGDGGRAIKPTSKNIDPTVEAYIRKAAAARGINPDTAVAIADGEGLGGSTPERLTPGDFKNGQPTSFGPFQMHRGGNGSVGTEYEKATGHKVDDPAHWQEQIDFSLNWAKKNGWAAWYGRSKHGIGLREGLDYDPAANQNGKQIGGNVPGVNGVGGLDQNQGGATRRQPITAALQKQIVAAATAAGVNAEVYSGGQDAEGPNRTGSHRHDHGNAADLKLYVFNKDGSKRYLSMANDADRKVMETFLREGVKAGANGIGAAPDYMGVHGIHIGGGSPSAWGAGGSSANAPDWVRRALDQGMTERSSPAATATAPKPNMTPGGFDVNKLNPSDAMKAPPLGTGPTSSTTSNDNRAVNQTINNTTTINEARNTKEAGRMMEGSFSRMHSMALQNAQSAVA